nr:hypothetical protein [Tanacetum cinerariifolium]
AQQSPHHDTSSSSHQTASTETIPTTIPIEIPTLRQYSRRATRIAQSKALPTTADKPASLLRDVSQGEAFPTITSLDARQDMESIIKTSALPHDSTVRVTSLDADEGISTVGGVPTVSGLVPTVSAIFTTASVVTPYSRRPREISVKDKGKEKMVESDIPKKKKLQEQIDIARDAEIARIHVEEELKMMIDGLDRSNEMIAKHLHEYEQAAADLTIGEKIKLINELVKYQDHHAKILKYRAQQSKPLSKKEQREFYMLVLKIHSRWKPKHFRGMTSEEIREKFIPVWKQIEDFVPMSSKEEAKRFKRKGLRLEHGSTKKMKTSEERDYWKIIRLGGHTSVYQFFVDILKQMDREDLNQLWALVEETLSIRHASSDKEKELWVELKRLFEPDFENQLWTHT